MIIQIVFDNVYFCLITLLHIVLTLLEMLYVMLLTLRLFTGVIVNEQPNSFPVIYLVFIRLIVVQLIVHSCVTRKMWVVYVILCYDVSCCVLLSLMYMLIWRHDLYYMLMLHLLLILHVPCLIVVYIIL